MRAIEIGTRRPSGNGYVLIKVGDERGWIYEHVYIAERASDKRLPAGVEVHHVDDNTTNNVPSNLVICQDRAYHQLLHLRAKAYRATGDANKRQCRICKQWDDPKSLAVYTRQEAPNGVGSAYHRTCNTEKERRRRARPVR